MRTSDSRPHDVLSLVLISPSLSIPGLSFPGGPWPQLLSMLLQGPFDRSVNNPTLELAAWKINLLFSLPFFSKYKIQIVFIALPHFSPLLRTALPHLGATLISVNTQCTSMAPCPSSCYSFCQDALLSLSLPDRLLAFVISASGYKMGPCSSQPLVNTLLM